MDLSCEVVRDLLPLYHDGVCSGESRALVEAHLKNCPACRAELETYETEPKEKNMDDAQLIAGTAKTWKKSKAAAFFRGALIVASLACLSCLIAYNAIGSYVAEDGRLVEAFGFIPLAWLFALLALLSAAGLFVFSRKPGKKI